MHPVDGDCVCIPRRWKRGNDKRIEDAVIEYKLQVAQFRPQDFHLFKVFNNVGVLSGVFLLQDMNEVVKSLRAEGFMFAGDIGPKLGRNQACFAMSADSGTRNLHEAVGLDIGVYELENALIKLFPSIIFIRLCHLTGWHSIAKGKVNKPIILECSNNHGLPHNPVCSTQ